MSNVLPFYLETIKAILSDEGKDDLKQFLRELMIRADHNDKKKLQALINEVQQGQIKFMDPEKWYVVYRGQRTFAAAAMKGKKNTVIESHLTYMEVLDETIAYYYAAVLNYLVSKTQKGFIRNQFARPLYAILKAQLQWEGEEWQKVVTQFSKDLHNKVKDVYKDISSNKVNAYIKQLEKFYEWRQLVEIFDSHVQNLSEVLAYVSNRTMEDIE